ncbi:ABC transporter permease [Dongia sedimenti]|uniref:ABC transporter permease n=1 Tax=Dongia sedimenti TaxID=3064282 RepID=A0ABU0YUD7_9PROT|nr:ABC transporter permease [Rhodospirillaceae bacterium R-7]
MLRHAINIFRLGMKELASLSRDVVMMVLILYTFTMAVYDVAKGVRTEVQNAAVAIVDDDGSDFSRRLFDAIQPPYFQHPIRVARDGVEDLLNHGDVTFVLHLPPKLQADLLSGRQPEIAIEVDATAMTQAGVGTSYLQNIVVRTAREFLDDQDADSALPATVVTRALFNPNLESLRFNAVMQVLENVTILAIILVGAAVMRERERGTIEHLMVMPVTAAEIALAKIWANGLVILVAVALSLIFVVGWALGVPVSGSLPLFLGGAALYLFAATSLGILLATVANSMPQLGLLAIPIFVVMNLLSGTTTPMEAMPEWLGVAMQISPSTHFVALSQAILYRGAGIETVWPQMSWILCLGLGFLLLALLRFHAMLARQA